MAINLAEDSVHALNRAAAAAAREDHEATGPRHILVGVLSQRDPALLEILDAMGLDPDALPAELRDAPETFGGHLPFTPAAHEVLAAAIESSTTEGFAATDTPHLLLGAAQRGDDECRGILDEWGLTADALAAALEAKANEDEAGEDEAGEGNTGEGKAGEDNAGEGRDAATAQTDPAGPQ